MHTSDDSTNPLIPFAPRQLGSAMVNTVNARDLHAFLQIAKEYSTWIKTWLRKAHLIENRDYIVISLEGRNPHGGRTALEHHLTFDAAKCVGMMSGSAKGDEVRAYFLECERRATALPTLHDPALQAILNLTIDLDATKFKLAQLEAKTNAAIELQAWMTIHQYVVVHKLERQMPESQYAAYGKHLSAYCLEKGYRVYPQPVAYQRWDDENAYFVQAIHDTLPAWLMRRSSQHTLIAIERRKP